MSRSNKNSNVITLHDDEDTFAAPSGVPSVLWTLDSDNLRHRLASVAIDLGVSAGGSAVITAGAYWVAYEGIAGKHRRIGDVNGGVELTISADVGFEELLVNVLGAFTALVLVGTVSDKINVTLTPQEEVSLP